MKQRKLPDNLLELSTLHSSDKMPGQALTWANSLHFFLSFLKPIFSENSYSGFIGFNKQAEQRPSLLPRLIGPPKGLAPPEEPPAECLLEFSAHCQQYSQKAVILPMAKQKMLIQGIVNGNGS